MKPHKNFSSYEDPVIIHNSNSNSNKEELLIIPRAHKKFALTYLVIILIIFIFWLFLGALTVDVQGKGIFMDRGGLYDVEAGTTGTIAQILVRPREFVKKGEAVALITNHLLDLELNFAQKQLKDLEKEYLAKRKSIAQNNEENKISINKQIEANNKKIEKLEKEIPDLRHSYESKLKLSKEGLVSNSNVLAAEKLLIQRLSSLEITKSTITTLKANLLKTLGGEELINLEKRILERKEQIEILELNLKHNILTSPANARILEILVDVGERVSPGKKLMWFETAEPGAEDIVVYGFAAGDIAKRIPLGTHLLLKPTLINLREYGAIIGEVIDISPYVIPSTEIDTYLHSQGLKDFLARGIPSPYLLTIKPLQDPSTPSGFKWTSTQIYPYKISTGAVCYISGVAYYERPIVRLLPLWRIEYFIDYLHQKFMGLISTPDYEREL